jgi:hypothetical protein
MGEVIYNKVQYGIEATAGTAVAATNQWPGTITVPTDRTYKAVEVHTGTRARSIKQANHQIFVDGFTLSMPEGFFQKVPLLMQMFWRGTASGSSQTGVQTDYLWDGTPSLTATNAHKTATIEFGDNSQAHEINWSVGRKLTFSGTLGNDEAVSVELEGFAQQRANSTFTAGIVQASSALDVMSANMTRFYVDNTWATSGCTVKPDILRAFNIEYTNGNHAKFTSTGSKTFNQTGEGYYDSVWTLTFEANATAQTEIDMFTSGSSRQLCLDIIGPAISGTTNTHKVRHEAFGFFSSAIPMASTIDGNNVNTYVFNAISNGSGTPTICAMKVTTNVNSV